jgi:hypothetical protein
VVGGVDVKAFEASVYTPELAVSPLKVSPVNVGDAPVCMFCGVESVMLPLPLATLIWLAVPVSVVLVRPPAVFPISSCPSV